MTAEEYGRISLVKDRTECLDEGGMVLKTGEKTDTER